MAFFERSEFMGQGPGFRCQATPPSPGKLTTGSHGLKGHTGTVGGEVVRGLTPEPRSLRLLTNHTPRVR